VSVPAGAGAAAGEPTAALAPLSITSDRTAPTAKIAAVNPDGVNPIPFTVTFSEDVTSVTAGLFSATNSSDITLEVVSGKVYRVLVTPADPGQPVTLTMSTTGITDLAGNAPTAATVQGTFTPGVNSDGLSNSAPSPTHPGLTTTSSGLKIRDISVGSGAAVATGQQVTVHYTGWLLDGTKFDSSVDRGIPAQFTVTTGPNGVIAGFAEGLVGMQVGGIRQLVIPADLAYGSEGRPNIPPDSVLIFEIKLISIP
jgi:hypothetical protein